MAGALMVIDTETSAEVDAVEQFAHVVERIDRHAEPAHLAQGRGIVAIEAHERRQIEGRAEAGLPLGEEEAKALVGLAGGAEAGELPHGPQPAAVHAGVNAARVRVLAGETEVGFRIEVAELFGSIQRLDGDAADRGGRLLARRRRRFPFPSGRGPRYRVRWP